MSDKLVKIFSTFFYVGNCPFAPGTVASLAAALMCIVLSGSLFFYVLVFITFTVVGFKVSGRMEILIGKKDPGCVVIDEVSGVMISFFLLPMNISVFFTTFFLFRALSGWLFPITQRAALG